jgi:hypothetical protein
MSHYGYGSRATRILECERCSGVVYGNWRNGATHTLEQCGAELLDRMRAFAPRVAKGKYGRLMPLTNVAFSSRSPFGDPNEALLGEDLAEVSQIGRKWKALVELAWQHKKHAEPLAQGIEAKDAT